MVEITKTCEGSTVRMTLVGRLDTRCAPELDAAIAACTGMEKLVLDFAGVEYIASSGLRVLAKAASNLEGDDAVVVENPNEVVRSVFDLVDFGEIVTIR